MEQATTMKRISASVPDRVFDQLNELADIEGRSFSNLVSYLLEKCIDARYEMNQAQGRLSKSSYQPKGDGTGAPLDATHDNPKG